MDALHFDRLTRSLTATWSRRTVGRALAGLTLSGAPAPLLGLGDAGARKKKKKTTCRKCGKCQTCRKGKCKPKPDGIGCAFGKTCRGGRCACSPGTTEIAGRCTEACTPTCMATVNCCLRVFDGDQRFCGRDFRPCADALPCTNHSGCATNELCVNTQCPAVNGITHKCAVLC